MCIHLLLFPTPTTIFNVNFHQRQVVADAVAVDVLCCSPIVLFLTVYLCLCQFSLHLYMCVCKFIGFNVCVRIFCFCCFVKCFDLILNMVYFIICLNVFNICQNFHWKPVSGRQRISVILIFEFCLSAIQVKHLKMSLRLLFGWNNRRTRIYTQNQIPQRCKG